MTNIFKLIFWIFFFILLFMIDLDNSFHYLDCDYGWHLQVGEEILSTRQAPRINVDNFTLLNRGWIDHEWAMNGFIAVMDKKAGYIGVSVFFASLAVFILGLLAWIIKQSSKSSDAVLFIPPLFIIGLLAMSPHLGVRVQEIALVNILILVIIIRSYEHGRTKAAFFLPILFLFWANLHGTFILGFAIIFAWFVARLSWPWMQKMPAARFLLNPPALSHQRILIFMLAVIASFLATLINPYSWHLYEFLGGYADTFYLTHVVEWTPIYYFPLQYWQIFYAALVWAAILLWFLSRGIAKQQNASASQPVKKFPADLWEIGLILVFFVLAIKSKRNFPIFYVISLPLVIKLAIEHLPISRQVKDFFNSGFGAMIKAYILLCLVLVIAGKAAQTPFTSQPFESYCRSFPCSAVDFLKSHPEFDQLKLYNEYGWGGFLLRTLPSRQLFIDGRFPQIKYQNTSILEEYYQFRKPGQAESKLNEHGIGLVLLDTSASRHKINWIEKYFLLINETAVNKNDNELKKYLDASSEWKVIYSNETATIYSRIAP